MVARKKGLGKGLDSLIPDNKPVKTNQTEMVLNAKLDRPMPAKCLDCMAVASVPRFMQCFHSKRHLDGSLTDPAQRIMGAQELTAMYDRELK